MDDYNNTVNNNENNSAEVNSTAGIECKVCGCINSPDCRFCTGCGAVLNDSAQQDFNYNQNNSYANNVYTNSYPNPPYQNGADMNYQQPNQAYPGNKYGSKMYGKKKTIGYHILNLLAFMLPSFFPVIGYIALIVIMVLTNEEEQKSFFKAALILNAVFYGLTILLSLILISIFSFAGFAGLAGMADMIDSVWF